MADLKSFIFPVDPRVDIRSWPIMWICYRLLFTSNLKKKKGFLSLLSFIVTNQLENHLNLIKFFFFKA